LLFSLNENNPAEINVPVRVMGRTKPLKEAKLFALNQKIIMAEATKTRVTPVAIKVMPNSLTLIGLFPL
jgi:hypothetical protein